MTLCACHYSQAASSSTRHLLICGHKASACVGVHSLRPCKLKEKLTIMFLLSAKALDFVEKGWHFRNSEGLTGGESWKRKLLKGRVVNEWLDVLVASSCRHPRCVRDDGEDRNGALTTRPESTTRGVVLNTKLSFQ